MQFFRKIVATCSIVFATLLLPYLHAPLMAQVSSVTFGKNRVQFKKFNWQYLQSPNFNVYFYDNGQPLSKYAVQVAEEALVELEGFLEEGLQRRINLVLYNNFDDLQQSNIGADIDWQNTGGITKLVNNKMVVYFNGDKNDLKKQIREGIAKVLLDNQLFGDDLGEFTANKALLDLPLWLTNGYVKFAAENWNTKLDDELRTVMLANTYKNFYQFAFKKPDLAGHAFWFFIAEVYKKENVPYFLYLARVYKNLNTASLRISKKKFKDLLKEFMTYQQEKYYKDMRGRRNFPKGSVSVVEEVSEKKDFIRFTPNPAPRSQTYAVVEFRRGQYSVVLYENFINRKVLLKYGVRSRGDDINPNYPQLAWDGKGTRLAVVYPEAGKLKLFVYDVVARFKRTKQDLDMFNQVQDMKYMLDANTLLFSAVRNGQTDVYTYKIEQQKIEQVTNDIYDDLDATFVTFPNKTGIVFSSNRPNPDAKSSDTSMPSSRYNIFLASNWNEKENYRQITQLTNMKYGNARMPTQYNVYHFTFVSDENGIANRYAGFFSTERAGLDTLIIIGEDILRNPDIKEVDSTLKLWGKNDIDSVAYVSITNDSTFTFPITNYTSGLLETKIAGDNGLVSEVTKMDEFKYLYKLRVNETALRRRNINAAPTEYMKKKKLQEKLESGEATTFIKEPKVDSAKTNIFQTEFGTDTATLSMPGFDQGAYGVNILSKTRQFDYKYKFFSEHIAAGFSNAVLVNRYQPYAGGTGPIFLGNNNALSGNINLKTADLFEDWTVSGFIRLGSGLQDVDYLFTTAYKKWRTDVEFSYYRVADINASLGGANSNFPNKLFSNQYQVNFNYPLDRVRSLRANVGIRSDKYVFRTAAGGNRNLTLPDTVTNFALTHVEYVYDNTLNPTQNIWHGLRYKIFMDWQTKVSNVGQQEGRFLFNVGFDARHYLPIYRNIIWAVRGAGDFSWGNQKVIYYLGGIDGELFPKFDQFNTPDPDGSYAFQSLAVNLRGYNQNVANGNNAVVINSEIRVPVFTTLFNKPINNAFLRNFQLVQFLDLGTAWNGNFRDADRPTQVFTPPADQVNNPLRVLLKPGGAGPFAGGYGFGARSTLFGYFLRADFGWGMNGFFRGNPRLHVGFGLDF